MVDRDMQAALGVTSYQGRWALILDSVGELGPTLSLEGRLFRGAGPQTVLAYSTCGGDGPHNILSLSFLFTFVIRGDGPILDSVGELGVTLSLENNSCFLMADKN